MDLYNNNQSQTGFTNNFLESRDSKHFFDQKYTDFPLYEEPRGSAEQYSNHYNTNFRDIIKNFQERSVLSDAFFSHKNIQFVKVLICNDVKKRSNGLYGITPDAQSDDQLLLVMRSIFLDNARHLPENIRDQVAELNYLVLLDMVPRVMSNIKLRLSFIRDHSQQYLPMERPQWMSSAGTKSASTPMQRFI